MAKRTSSKIAAGILAVGLGAFAIALVPAPTASAHDGGSGQGGTGGEGGSGYRGGSGYGPALAPCLLPSPHRPSWCASHGDHPDRPSTRATPTNVGPAVVPDPEPLPPALAIEPAAPSASAAASPTAVIRVAEVPLAAALPDAPTAVPPEAPTSRTRFPGGFLSPIESGGGTVPLGLAVGLGIAGLVTGVLVGLGARGHLWRRPS